MSSRNVVLGLLAFTLLPWVIAPSSRFAVAERVAAQAVRMAGDEARLSAVVDFVDNALDKGRDRWSGDAAPLFVDGLEVETGEPVEWLRSGRRSVSNVMRRSTDVLAADAPDVAEAIGFIRRHACDRSTVGDMLAQVNVSRAAREPKFKALLGRTFHQEIQRVQIERAKELLRTIDLPIKAVAQRAGFNSVQYLTPVFSAATGLTAYRGLDHADVTWIFDPDRRLLTGAPNTTTDVREALDDPNLDARLEDRWFPGVAVSGVKTSGKRAASVFPSRR